MSNLLDKNEILTFTVIKYGRGAAIESLLEQAGKLSEEYVSGTLDDGDAIVTWRFVNDEEELTYKAQLEAIHDNKASQF